MIGNLSKKEKMLGLGCSTFGGSKSKKIALRALNDAFDLGINYFDTARSYGYGQSEAILGEFVRGKRDGVVLTSKFGISPPKPFPFMSQVKDAVRFIKKIAPGISQQAINAYSNSNVSRPSITPRLVIETLERSLAELKTDYLDFYLLHDCPFENAVNDDVCAALEKAKDKGMVRAWGATCESPSELHRYFKKSSPFGVVQFQYGTDNVHVSDGSSPEISKVVFSVMSQAAGQKEPPPSFFRQLPANQKMPGLVQNLQEAWLYIASQELDRGVVLCSMTQRKHIERNIAILNAPGISNMELAAMKEMVMGGVATVHAEKEKFQEIGAV